MRARSGASVVVAIGLCALAAAPARAEDAAVLAKGHFDAGLRAFDAGEYSLARDEFEEAYKLRPYPDLLMNIATSWERMYRAASAREYYERFLAAAPPDSDLRPLAEKRLRVLRSLPGSILVDAGKEGAAVALTADAGEVRTDRSPHRFDLLPPGNYHIHVSAPGYQALDQDITLAPGESQTVTQRLQPQLEQVSVFSTPDRAHVFLDDADTGGQTTWSRAVPVGEHTLRLELPDRPPRLVRFALEKGKPYLANVVLAPPPRSGRTELVLAAMAIGGYAGGALTVALGGNQVTTGTGILATGLVAVGGVGLGFLGAWALTSDAMKVGHSSIIIGSSLWGTVAGLSLSLGLGLTGDQGQRTSQQNLMAVSVLGTGIGVGAGILTAWLANPTPGDSALVNSGALWGLLGTGLLTEALSLRAGTHDPALGWLTLGGNVAGLATGALLARALDVSRGQVAVVDAAGLLGTLLGYGLGFAVGSDLPDPNSGTFCPAPVNRCVSGARYALGGMALGLLSAAVITRRFKFELPPPEALLHHDRGGRWRLGLPNVRFATGLTPNGADQRAVLDLVTGVW